MLAENVLIQFEETALSKGEAVCLKFKKGKEWQSLNWLEVLSRIKQLALGLKQLGIKAGDKISILSNTRYEWTLADMAILSLGAITVPIYQNIIAEEAKHILKDSGAKLIFVEDKNQLEKIEKSRKDLKSLEKVILISGKSVSGDVLTFKEVLRLGSEATQDDFSERIRKIKGSDLASLVYTSGTTGMPKGVMLIHDNIVKEIDALISSFPIMPGYQSLMFLPLAHILARAVQFFQLSLGFVHAYAQSIDSLLDDLKEIKPHFLVSVPRIFEKIHTKVMSDLAHAPRIKKVIFNWAVQLGTRVGQGKLNGEGADIIDQVLYPLANQLVFSKLHQRLGGNLKFFVSGGAPLSKEIAEFFNAAGMLILEGYGLTETCGATNVNTPEHCVFGTVGKTVIHCEQKIADDGEILVKGGMVFKGYYNNPQATAEVFEGEWFKTGDIGEFDKNGHLKITDRKKDIIVTAAGKNIAPQNIENQIKTESLISQVMVHGDRRKYLTALITLNEQEIFRLAKSEGISFDNYTELVQHQQIFQRIKKIIEEKNKKLASYETIKKFAILETDFTIESGELTPSLKVKRKFISQKYKELLDSFYTE